MRSPFVGKLAANLELASCSESLQIVCCVSSTHCCVCVHRLSSMSLGAHQPTTTMTYLKRIYTQLYYNITTTTTTTIVSSSDITKHHTHI